MCAMSSQFQTIAHLIKIAQNLPPDDTQIHIELKLACLTYNAFSTSTPRYLQPQLTPDIPDRCIQLSSAGLSSEQLWACMYSMPWPQRMESCVTLFSWLMFTSFLQKQLNAHHSALTFSTGHKNAYFSWWLTNLCLGFTFCAHVTSLNNNSNNTMPLIVILITLIVILKS